MSEKKIIEIEVRGKIARLKNPDDYLVCGNSDYFVRFDFDNEWDEHHAKTALFVFGDTTIEQPFKNEYCEGVEVEKATKCYIGAFSGDIVTTTKAEIKCLPSIRDIAKHPRPPKEDVYNKIIALINQMTSGSGIIIVDELPTIDINLNAFYRYNGWLYWYDTEWHKLIEFAYFEKVITEELANKQDNLAFNGEYDEVTNKVATEETVEVEKDRAILKENELDDKIYEITINKVNVSDIADDLDTEDPNKVLSANQGRIIKRDLGIYYQDLQSKDTENAEAIEAEKNRAEAVESDIYEKLDDINADADKALSIADDALDVAKEAKQISDTTEANLEEETARATKAEEQIISDFTASDEQIRADFAQSDAEIKSDLETTDAIAKGANVALAFTDYEAMVNKFNSISSTEYRVGQNVLIGTLNVPDLWVSKIYDDYLYYNYELEGGDSVIVSYIENYGHIRVGYYDLSPLETQKVVMTDYVKFTDVASPDKFGVVKVGNLGMQINPSGYIYPVPASEGNIDIRSNYLWLTPYYMDYALKVGISGYKKVNNVESWGNQIDLGDKGRASAQKWLGVPSASKTYTFSNNGEDVSLTYGGEAYHQSSDTYSVEQIIGASYGYYDENYTHSNTISESMIVDNTEDGITIQIDKNFAYIFIAYTTKFVPSVSKSPLPKVGIYFSYYDSDGDLYYITNLTLNVIDERKYSKKTEAIDYADNDTSSPSHIHNRPCYVRDEFDKTYPPSMSANSTSIEGISSYIQEWYYCIDPATFSPNDANWYKKFMSDIGAYAINVEYSNYCTGRQITGTRRYSLSGANIRRIVGGYIISVKTGFTPDAYLLLLYDAIAFGDTIQNSSFNNGVYLGRIVVDDDTGGNWHNDESRITMLYKMQVKALDNSLLDLSNNAFLLQNLLNFKKAVVPNGKSFSLKSGMFAMVFPNDMIATLKQTNGNSIVDYEIGASLIYVSDIADNKCDIALMSFRSNPPSTSVGSYTPNQYGVVGYITNVTTTESPKDLYVYYLERG